MRVHVRRVVVALVGIVSIGGLLIQLLGDPQTASHIPVVVHSRNPGNLIAHLPGITFNHSAINDTPSQPPTARSLAVSLATAPAIDRSQLTHNVNASHIWPESFERDDRVLAQMQLKPKTSGSKRILVYNGISQDKGNTRFIKHQCPVTDCELTGDREEASSADAILFEGSINEPTYKLHKERPPHQLWVLFFLESPMHTMGLKNFYGKVNWTATYRRDSTLVTPYERWTPFANFSALPVAPPRDYAKGKTKQVAWFVSNCGATNGRLNYAKELGKYINVDIYGSCGTHKCPRNKGSECDALLRNDYKFYLAFENSNCQDYITEKLYWNAYLNDVLPVVMGARPEDYERSAPPNSYIHVDSFSTPRALADYLHLLDTNDHLYNQYFRWKGTGSYIDTKFWCRLCSMVHEVSNSKHESTYMDLNSWWRDSQTCVGVGHGQDWATWRER